MNPVTSQPFSAAAYGGRQAGMMHNRETGHQVSQSMHAAVATEAALTIQTREGDVVTLASSSFSRLDAGIYNSRGTLVTETGSAVSSVSHRQVTLSSGQAFSFSVQGDLNATELSDIDDIILRIDSILSEMAAGNMDEAIAQALAMEGYDTISGYSADLSSRRTFQSVYEARYSSISEPFPDTDSSFSGVMAAQVDVEEMMARIRELLARQEDEILDAARRPVRQLVDHHLEELEARRPVDPVSFRALTDVSRQMDSLMDLLTKAGFDNIFKSTFGLQR